MSLPAISRVGFGGVVGVELVPSGLRFSPGLPFDDWTLIGGQLSHHREWSAFAIGDWLLHGDTFYEEFSQGAEALKKEPGTLSEFMRIAGRFPHQRRRPGLTWSHHQAVAAIADDAEQDRWLDRAESEGWKVAGLRAALRNPDAPRRLGDGEGHPDAPYIGLMSQVVRELLGAARPTREGYAEVPEHVLDRLANAVGVQRR